MIPDQLTRRKIEGIASNAFSHLNAQLGYPVERSCILWAVAAVYALKQAGYRAGMNAGTALFRINYSAEGIDSYGYEWQETSCSTEQLQGLGYLPELHAWAVAPDAGLLVDMTTGFLPYLVTESGLRWEVAEPPAVLWADIKDIPAGYYYRPYEQACELTYALANKFLRKVGNGEKAAY